ncbi:hypothetical protein JI435_403740 [Parastagonospora nodorum SN15]|uniref:Uncharacterized protein n=1 Tax=Phaeosphaeria nodorum (strain SN15 / ATCC MYA-4574 / FGSC 10173) TaxID=321614 RepID=A0A7U2EVB5_PHANO|nr:hypothetical protein JI435_403740 [Parastagonospora nodorum SN15]
MEGRKQGRPEEELFLRPADSNPQTPTVGPLRIQKGRDGMSPPPRTDSAGSSSQAQSQPAFSRPPPMPSFPAPPTAPPTAPLPYPTTARPSSRRWALDATRPSARGSARPRMRRPRRQTAGGGAPMRRARVPPPPASARDLKLATRTGRRWEDTAAGTQTVASSPRGWRSAEALRPSRCPSRLAQRRPIKRASLRNHPRDRPASPP